MEQILAGSAYGLQNDDNSEDATNTISPLPPVLRHGLTAVSIFGLISFLTTLSLFIYLSYKLIIWQVGPAPAKQQPCSPQPESPTISDVNGFLVPDEHLCPQKDGVDDEPQDFSGSSILTRLRREPPNQFLVLIYNLLFADIQQAMAFLLNVAWLSEDAVAVGTTACWTQGWFISTGDLASSVWISAIAAHTYLGVIKGYRLPTWLFYTAVASLWVFVYGLALLGIVVTRNGQYNGGLYVRAGAWCWINSAYQDLRLYLHYLWIFLSLAFTSLTYSAIFIHLRIQSKPSGTKSLPSLGEHYPNPDPNDAAHSPPAQPMSPTSVTTDISIKRLPPIPSSARHPTFLLYPLIYMLCTAPLALGRISSMAGHDVSLAYFCFAGSMIASAGWLDVVLYSYTRRSIVFSGEGPPSQDIGLETFAFMRTPPGRRFGNLVYVAGGDSKCHDEKRWAKWNWKALDGARLRTLRNEQNSSVDTLRGFGMGGGEVMGMAIQRETVTTVVVEIQNEKNGVTGNRQRSIPKMPSHD